MSVGGLGRSHDFFLARAGARVRNVLPDAGRKQQRFLQDDRKLVAQIRELVLAQVAPVEQNLALRRIVETREKIDEGALETG